MFDLAYSVDTWRLGCLGLVSLIALFRRGLRHFGVWGCWRCAGSSKGLLEGGASLLGMRNTTRRRYRVVKLESLLLLHVSDSQSFFLCSKLFVWLWFKGGKKSSKKGKDAPSVMALRRSWTKKIKYWMFNLSNLKGKSLRFSSYCCILFAASIISALQSPRGTMMVGVGLGDDGVAAVIVFVDEFGNYEVANASRNGWFFVGLYNFVSLALLVTFLSSVRIL